MSIKFRTPPKIPVPETTRWEGVFRLPDEIEIWFLSLRKAHSGFYPVFCKLKGDKPMPLYPVPLTADQLKTDKKVVKDWGNRFFWSRKEATFVVQLLHTFEYSERLEVEQLFLVGEEFLITKTLKDENLIVLPTRDFKEVYPEMHPDRSRLD